jgi:nicotinamidase-related amidase
MTRALVVIDPQKIYTSPSSEMHCADADATMKRINKLISAFEASGEPIIFVRHVHKADGSDLGRMFDFTGEAEEEFNFVEGTEEVDYDDRLSTPAGAMHFVKNRYSAFSNPAFLKHLKAKKISKIVICGFMTNFCCDSTCRDAHDLDFYVDFIIDATGSPGTDNLSEKQVRKYVSELLSSGFCVVHRVEDFLLQKKV